MTFGKTTFFGTLACFVFSIFTTHLHAESIEPVAEPEVLQKVEVTAGYRALSKDGFPGRAKEYDSLQDGPTLQFFFKRDNENSNLDMGLNFLDEDDYYFEGDVNFKSGLRFKVLEERMFHNLDHLPYDQASEPEARPDGVFDGDTRIDYFDLNPEDVYGLRIDQTEVSARAKIPTFPAHVNLKYWRWEKKGRKQLRFVNDSCTGCHMQSRSQEIDRVTQEVTAGVDAHLGYFDLALEQVVRTFEDRAATPVDSFEESLFLLPGDYQHDGSPDAKFTQSTIKVNSAVSGGFVADASYSIGKRESESAYSDVDSGEIETKFHKLASNVTYTPSSHWTVTFRYRLLDMDANNPDRVTADGLQYVTYPPPDFEATPDSRSGSLDVRESIDITRGYYAASLAYRPTSGMTFRADYHREDIHRSNTGEPVPHEAYSVDPVEIDPYWELPEDEVVQKYRVSFSSRLMKKSALKIKAWYQYQTSDDPAYSISIEEGHKGFASIIYRPGPVWGGTMSFMLLDAKNTGYQRNQFDDDDMAVPFELDRRQKGQNAALGLWLNALESLSFDLNYGYLNSRIVQDVLFGAEPPEGTIEDKVSYRQYVHTLALGTEWRPSKVVSCRLEGYHIRSEAEYSPNFPAEILAIGVASPEDLRDISKVDIRQNGLSGRISWQIDEQWAASMEATYDDYDDRDSDIFDGSVQTYTASLSRVW